MSRLVLTFVVLVSLMVPPAAGAAAHHRVTLLTVARAKLAITRFDRGEYRRQVTVGPCRRMSRATVRCDFRQPAEGQDQPGWIEEGFAIAYLHVHRQMLTVKIPGYDGSTTEAV